MPSIMQREFACETIPSRSISSSTSCRPSCDAGSAHVFRPIDVGEFVGIPGNKPRTGQQIARADVEPSFAPLRKIPLVEQCPLHRKGSTHRCHGRPPAYVSPPKDEAPRPP